MNKLIITLSIIFFFSCSSDFESNLHADIQGEWINMSKSKSYSTQFPDSTIKAIKQSSTRLQSLYRGTVIDVDSIYENWDIIILEWNSLNVISHKSVKAHSYGYSIDPNGNIEIQYPNSPNIVNSLVVLHDADSISIGNTQFSRIE